MLISGHSLRDLKSCKRLHKLIIEKLFFLKSRLVLYTISITALPRSKKYQLFSDVLLHYIYHDTNNLEIKQLITIQNKNIVNIIFLLEQVQ